jgi:hypothetical protein
LAWCSGLWYDPLLKSIGTEAGFRIYYVEGEYSLSLQF